MQDEHTDVPPLPPEEDPAADVNEVLGSEAVAPPPSEPSPGGRRRRREPDPAEPPGGDGPRSADVTEAQLVRAFYWAYRAWCKLLGAEVDVHREDFRDLGRAWLELARRMPGIRWAIALAGPIFTFTDLFDKLARAWEARTRFREGLRIPNWRQRSQDGNEAQASPGFGVVDGGTGAP